MSGFLQERCEVLRRAGDDLQDRRGELLPLLHPLMKTKLRLIVEKFRHRRHIPVFITTTDEHFAHGAEIGFGLCPGKASEH